MTNNKKTVTLDKDVWQILVSQKYLMEMESISAVIRYLLNQMDKKEESISARPQNLNGQKEEEA